LGTRVLHHQACHGGDSEGEVYNITFLEVKECI
jgi:hypothetical protein